MAEINKWLFWRPNSRFRKRFSKIGLSYNVAFLIRMRASLVQTDTEMADKYSKRYPNNNDNNQRYSISSHSEDMAHDVCQH